MYVMYVVEKGDAQGARDRIVLETFTLPFSPPRTEKEPSQTMYMCITWVPTWIKMPFRQKCLPCMSAARLGMFGRCSSKGMLRRKL